MGRHPVGIAASLQHAMAGNDDDKGVVEQGMGDRSHAARSSEPGGDLVIGAGLTMRNPPDQLIDPLIENRASG
jgi:hypothetical protein